jgi:predicted secreted acid phosphatase
MSASTDTITTTIAVPSNGSSSLSKGKIKAIIYDLDGTLLDTETLSTEAIQEVVGRRRRTFTWYVASCLSA